ncbi:MAG: hypothetical protein C5B60_03015 [Chloroflexi bacterium]|nr:MAG: hypothetical protein C5B60_03015 [Chloroflexota bacterium]
MESQYVTRNPLLGKVSYKKFVLLSARGTRLLPPSTGEDSLAIARASEKHPAEPGEAGCFSLPIREILTHSYYIDITTRPGLG